MTETQPTKAEMDAFKSPPVKFGQTVAWYATGTKGRAPNLAWCIRTGDRVVNLYVITPGGGTIVAEAVRHIDDPKLRLNSDQRENGAWDYTDYDKERKDLVSDMHRRLKACEIAVINMPDFGREVLVKNARKYGITGAATMSTDELRAEIKAKIGEQADVEVSEQGTPQEVEPTVPAAQAEGEYRVDENTLEPVKVD